MNSLGINQFSRAIKFAEENGQPAARDLAKHLHDNAMQSATSVMFAAGDRLQMLATGSGAVDDWLFVDPTGHPSGFM